MTAIRRVLALALFGSFCVYVLLPFQTPVPGLNTFTALKAVSALLLLASLLPPGLARPLGDAVRGWLLPFALLAVWCPMAAMVHPVWAGLDAKMFLGVGAGVLVAVALQREVARPATRQTAVRILLWGGGLAAGMAVLEPLTTPAWDGFWRYFRPNLPVYNAVFGDVDALHWIHWNVGGLFRLSGIQDSPNSLAALLALWLPLAGGVAAADGRWWRWVGGMSAVALVLAGTMTRSIPLAAAIGCVVASSVLVLDGLRMHPRLLHQPQPWLLILYQGVLLAGIVVVLCAGEGGGSAALVALVGVASASGLMAFMSWLARAAPRRRSPLSPQGGGQGPAGLAMFAAILALPLLLPLLGARFNQSAEQASAERRLLWRAACHLIREAPLAGPGYHRYYDVIQHDPVLGVPSLYGDFGRAVDNPHNLYLAAAVSGGMPALGLLVAAFIVLLRLAGRAMRDVARPAATRWLAAALFAYWIGYVLSALVGRNVFIVNESLAFHALAALTAAASLPSRAGRRR